MSMARDVLRPIDLAGNCRRARRLRALVGRLRCVAWLGLFFAGAVVTAGRAAAEPADRPPPAESIDQFEREVRPIFVKHCQSCHGAKKQEGDLRLDSRSGLARGGADGAVVIAGVPEESRLIRAVRYQDEGLQMPPDGALPAEAVAALVEWVRRGAVWPEGDAAAGPSPERAWKGHWAAQPFARRLCPRSARRIGWPRRSMRSCWRRSSSKG